MASHVYHGQQRASSRYSITLFNQHAMCGIKAYGRTRKQAFDNALIKAGEPFLRHGGDKLTTFRSLFFDHCCASYYRSAPHVYAEDPCGAGVELRKLEKN